MITLIIGSDQCKIRTLAACSKPIRIRMRLFEGGARWDGWWDWGWGWDGRCVIVVPSTKLNEQHCLVPNGY